jgi:type II secretory pathway pseudopilin PulG
MKQFNPIGIPSGSYGAGNKIMKQGFTLMEAIVAIFVITTGIVGVFALVTQTISSATYSTDRLIAAYLAQEGIEIVRNIRDTNWLEGGSNSWNEKLDTCSGGCRADYTYSQQVDLTLPAYTGQFLNIDVSGYYGYSGGSPTKFQRKITISSNVDGSLNVKVEVFWQEKGKPYKIEAQENLYDWY